MNKQERKIISDIINILINPERESEFTNQIERLCDLVGRKYSKESGIIKTLYLDENYRFVDKSVYNTEITRAATK